MAQRAPNPGRVAWLFPGQGSQRVGMTRALLAAAPSLAEWFTQVDAAVAAPLSTLIAEGPDAALVQTANQQPAIVAVSLAWLRALEARELAPEPAFVAGHSLGEYSALAAVGALDPLDAVRLVRRRGELMQEHGAGGMAAVIGLPPAAVAAIAADVGVEVANYNAPEQTTVTGRTEAVARAMALAKERGAKRVVRLPVSAAFHSSLMAPAIDGMAAALATTTIRPALAPLVANTDAEPIAAPEALRRELLEQICAPVRWTDIVRFLIDEGVTTFYEIGPGKVLAGLVGRCAPGATVIAAESLLAERA
ncbi:MAG TPA: ACP S-malonyltransferase [Thermomicrobiales bacterium]|jgi:[acyl-carrier-protein] S-malonyltransferase|nr:ACP S-malonyltransferase [Thermomicrobiales bacterium]